MTSEKEKPEQLNSDDRLRTIKKKSQLCLLYAAKLEQLRRIDSHVQDVVLFLLETVFSIFFFAIDDFEQVIIDELTDLTKKLSAVIFQKTDEVLHNRFWKPFKPVLREFRVLFGYELTYDELGLSFEIGTKASIP